MDMHEPNRNPHPSKPDDAGLKKLTAPKVEFRTYRGILDNGSSPIVWYETSREIGSGEPARHTLPMRLEIRNHSPSGFAWGYGGSGPAQLALALLVDAVRDAELALHTYQDFKREHVARWGREWSITAEEIQRFAARGNVQAERQRFPSGRIVATPAALAELQSGEIMLALRRHLSADWGELDRHDWDANEAALHDGSRLFSAYDSDHSDRFWIITEADRSVTTILLPADY